MNVPSYEVGRVAALTIRLMRASGLSHDDARAALGLACRMLDDEMARPAAAPLRTAGARPAAREGTARPRPR